MSEKDNGLDDIFRDKLKQPLEPPMYREEDWDAMQSLLDGRRKPLGIVFWLPVLSSAAAMLLLVGGWLFLRSKNNGDSGKNQPQLFTKARPAQPPLSDSAARKTAINLQKYNSSDTLVNPLAHNVSPVKRQVVQQRYASRKTGTALVDDRETLQTGTNDEYRNDLKLPTLAASSVPYADQNLATVQRISIPDSNTLKAKEPMSIEKNKNERVKRKLTSAFRPQYAIAVLAAPDLNSVGSFQQSKVGTNIGMQFSAQLISRFTVTTGVLYSDKPYSASFSNYHTAYQFKTDPESVSAECRMLDIPVNIGYQIYRRNQNTISIGTGLSSYIMLHERYSYTYSNPYATGPTAYTVRNTGKYFFGIANINASFEHQLNSRLGIEVQPYMKLPISNVGYGGVKLQSTGLAVGFNWKLGSQK
jgi:hypothetical protein